VAACVSGCGVCTECQTACNAHCTAPSTHTTTWNTCCHNTALLMKMYLHWLFLQKYNFSQAQCKLPEDGPNELKHAGKKRNFNIYLWSQNTDYGPNKSNLVSKALVDYLKAHIFIIHYLEIHVKSTYWQFNFLPPSGDYHCTDKLCIMSYYGTSVWIHLWHGQLWHSRCLLL
jgi:hypothetical protein